jgi:tripartite-type tricarboxylate transporter receptor subunit TctC
MAKRFEILGAEIVAGTPQALARVVRDDQAKWGKVIREKKITVE